MGRIFKSGPNDQKIPKAEEPPLGEGAELFMQPWPALCSAEKPPLKWMPDTQSLSLVLALQTQPKTEQCQGSHYARLFSSYTLRKTDSFCQETLTEHLHCSRNTPVIWEISRKRKKKPATQILLGVGGWGQTGYKP